MKPITKKQEKGKWKCKSKNCLTIMVGPDAPVVNKKGCVLCPNCGAEMEACLSPIGTPAYAHKYERN